MTAVYCRICGTNVSEDYSGSRERLLSAEVCFICDHWIEAFHKKNDPESVRINGQQYWIGKKDTAFKAQGGRKFAIKKGNETILTDNLWHNGRIPEQFQDQLADNAEFL